MPDDNILRELLKKASTIAIVGAKDKPGQAVDGVGRYLMAAGYKIIPVHPKHKNVWGLTTYRSLLEVPVAIDIVDVFRASEYCLEHAKEALNLSIHPKAFWLQLGIINDEACDLVSTANILAIQDKCIKIEHKRLFG